MANYPLVPSYPTRSHPIPPSTLTPSHPAPSHPSPTHPTPSRPHPIPSHPFPAHPSQPTPPHPPIFSHVPNTLLQQPFLLSYVSVVFLSLSGHSYGYKLFASTPLCKKTVASTCPLQSRSPTTSVLLNPAVRGLRVP